MPFKAHTRFNFSSSFKKNSLHAFDTILEFLRVNHPLTCRNYIVYSVNIVYNTSNFIVLNQTVEPIEHKRYKGCTFFYHFFMKTIVNNNI